MSNLSIKRTLCLKAKTYTFRVAKQTRLLQAIRISQATYCPDSNRKLTPWNIMQGYKNGERDFRGVHLTGPDWKFGKADLSGADFSNAKLTLAALEYADLRETKFPGATINKARLEGANLRLADLREANLGASDLSLSDLQSANLEGANLSLADLKRAVLSYANLIGATLIRANLAWADLIGASLEGSNLEGANLTGADLNGAKIDSKALTTLNTFEWEGLELEQKKSLWLQRGGEIVENREHQPSEENYILF